MSRTPSSRGQMSHTFKQRTYFPDSNASSTGVLSQGDLQKQYGNADDHNTEQVRQQECSWKKQRLNRTTKYIIDPFDTQCQTHHYSKSEGDYSMWSARLMSRGCSKLMSTQITMPLRRDRPHKEGITALNQQVCWTETAPNWWLLKCPELLSRRQIHITLTRGLDYVPYF